MRKSNQLVVFLPIIFIYVCSVFLLPTDPAILERFHFTQTQAYLLNLTVVAPMIAVWLSAYYGYSRFKSYADSINGSKDGRALHKLSKGLMILAFSLPILACIGSVFNYLAFSVPEHVGVMVIIRQILLIGFPLAAFIIISDATAELLGQLKRRKAYQHNNKILIPIVIAASSIFSGAIVALADNNATPKNIYSFPLWFVMFAAVIPYLYMWYRGAVAVYNLNFYRKHVRGHIYKQAFGYLSLGLGVVIFVAIALQFLTVLTPQLQRLNFTPQLFLAYTLIAFYALGYGLIAFGAKRLKRIEDV